MSIFSKGTEQDLTILRNLAEQQKNQRAMKIKNRILKQTDDIKLADFLSKITKKIDEVNQSTKKLGEVIDESKSINENNHEIVLVEIDLDNSEGDNIRALTNSSFFSELMTKTLGSLMFGSISPKAKSSPSGATILGVHTYFLRGDKLWVPDNDYQLAPEIYKALSYTRSPGKTMKNETDILMMNNIINDLSYTDVGDRPSNRKTFLTIKLPKLVDEIQNKSFDDYDLQGQGTQKIVIPSNIIDIYTSLEVLLGFKISGHSETLTEASNLIDHLFRMGKIQKEQQYRNAIIKFSKMLMELHSKKK